MREGINIIMIFILPIVRWSHNSRLDHLISYIYCTLSRETGDVMWPVLVGATLFQDVRVCGSYQSFVPLFQIPLH